MIIWLASYPKSGNTMLRAMLSAYFYTQNGIFNFDLLKNIRQFPDVSLFEKFKIDISNEDQVLRNYIFIQSKIREKFNNKIIFLKTHSALLDVNKHKFTNLINSLGVIYIVRDPRNIVLSLANHSSLSVEEAMRNILEFRIFGGNINSNKPENRIKTHVGSWSIHYKSWKLFDLDKKYFLIKYEDLINDPENIFLQVLRFLSILVKKEIKIDRNKIKNLLDTTSFEYMKNLENKFGFIEATTNKLNKKNKFFYKGKNNDWKQKLDNKTSNKIEESFFEEMKELKYL